MEAFALSSAGELWPHNSLGRMLLSRHPHAVKHYFTASSNKSTTWIFKSESKTSWIQSEMLHEAFVNYFDHNQRSHSLDQKVDSEQLKALSNEAVKVCRV